MTEQLKQSSNPSKTTGGDCSPIKLAEQAQAVVEARRKHAPKPAEPTKLAESTPKTPTSSYHETGEQRESREKYRQECLERERQRDEDRRRDRTREIMRGSGLPERHMQTLDMMEVGNEWQAAEKRAVKAVDDGDGVLLSGPRGVGKTQIATSCGRHVAGKQKTVHYTNASQLYRDCREGMQQGSETKVLDHLRRVGLLIVDECHVRGETDYEDRTLTELVNDRYSAMKPTILITNQNKAEAAKSLGASIVSRFHESGTVIECNWKSFRGHD